MKAYVVALIDVHDFDKYKPYMLEVPDSIARHGGSYVVRNGTKLALEGELPSERLVILQFPSMAHAQEWYRSREYQTLKAIRTSASEATVFLVEGT
jgi:uncharacterized protein (DUF1330 family)